MANPFLVLGGIAISVATAAFGVLQVPGWVAAAQDAAAANDLAQVAVTQAASASTHGSFTADLGSVEGVSATGSQGVVTRVAVSPNGERWAAVAVSASGRVAVRTSDKTKLTWSEGNYAANDSVAAAVAVPGVTLGGTAANPTIAVRDPTYSDWVVSSRNTVPTPNPSEYAGSGWSIRGSVVPDLAGGFISRDDNQPAASATWIVSSPSAESYKVGDKVTIAVTYRVDEVRAAEAQHVTVSIRSRNAPGEFLSARTTRPIVTGETVRAVLHWTADRDILAGNLDTVMYLSTAAGGYASITKATFAAREVVIERGHTAGTYYDGGTADDTLTRYSWEGPAGASPSIRETREIRW